MVRDSMTEPAKDSVNYDVVFVAKKSAKLASGRAAISAAVMCAKHLQVSPPEYTLGS